MVLTKQREKFSSNSNMEIKDLSSAAAGTVTDSVNFCSNLICFDSQNSHSHMYVKTYTSKYHDMCLILPLSLILLCWFSQHLQRPVLKLTDIFLRTLQHLVISALFSPHSLSLVCQNFQILLFCVCFLSLQAHQNYY